MQRRKAGLQVVPRHAASTGSISYYIAGSYLGERVRVSLGTGNEAEAQKIARRMIPKIEQKIEAGRLKSGSFAHVAQSYKDRGNDARFLGDLIETFGNRQIDTITDSEIIDYAVRRGNERDWSNHTRNRQVITPFQAVCNFGAKLKPPQCQPRIIERFPEQRQAIIAAPEDWIKAALVAAMHDGHPRMAALIMFATTTAVRISEALRLEWRDVNLDAGSALIRKTKNSRPRQVFLAASVQDALRTIRKDAPDTATVFGYANRSSVAAVLKAICARHGLQYFSSHKWGRHAFAERLLRMDKSLLMIKEAGGWASLQVVVDNYGHLERTHVEATVIEAARSISEIDTNYGTNSPEPLNLLDKNG